MESCPFFAFVERMGLPRCDAGGGWTVVVVVDMADGVTAWQQDKRAVGAAVPAGASQAVDDAGAPGRLNLVFELADAAAQRAAGAACSAVPSLSPRTGRDGAAFLAQHRARSTGNAQGLLHIHHTRGAAR